MHQSISSQVFGQKSDIGFFHPPPSVAGFLFINTFLAKSHDGLFKDDERNSSGLGAILAPPGWQWFYPTGDPDLPKNFFKNKLEIDWNGKYFPNS